MPNAAGYGLINNYRYKERERESEREYLFDDDVVQHRQNTSTGLIISMSNFTTGYQSCTTTHYNPLKPTLHTLFRVALSARRPEVVSESLSVTNQPAKRSTKREEII